MWRIKALSSGLGRPGDPKTGLCTKAHFIYCLKARRREGGGVRLGWKKGLNREQIARCREDRSLEAYLDLSIMST